jgi:hypothetical protein
MDAVLELLLPCELRGLTPHIRLPPRTKVFSGMFPFKHQYHPSSHQLKHNIFMFVTESVQNFSQLCILLYMALHTWDIFYGTLGGISSVVHTLWKLFKWILIQQNTFETHTVTSLWERQNTSGWVVHCSVLKYKRNIPSDTTQLNAIQHCATSFSSSELSSDTLC